MARMLAILHSNSQQRPKLWFSSNDYNCNICSDSLIQPALWHLHTSCIRILLYLLQVMLLAQVCCKKQQKSSNQETGLGNRGHLMHGFEWQQIDPIWGGHSCSFWTNLVYYHSEPSDAPYSPNQFLGWDFFAIFYIKTALTKESTLV